MENGSVVLYDELTKEDEYYIPAPYMFDAKGERSTYVHYKLNDLDNGQYTLTVIADTDWVNNNSRVFPVMIDPTLQQKILYDTYINSSEPGTNYGTSSELWVSSSKISYIRANLTSIPSGSEINFATFNAAYYYHSHITDGTLDVGVYQVEKSWTETGLTWNSASQYSNQGISTTRLSYRTLRGDAGAYQSSPKWQSFVITDAVNSWFNGSPNHGVALKRESGTNGSVIICSYEFGIDYRPYFIIFYKEPVITQGVYRLKNAYNGLYLTTGGTSYKTGAPIQQSASKGSNDLTQLFKITYIQDYSNDRYYDIRPMTNSALGLYAPLASSSTHTVTANSMATTDGWYDIPQTQRWTIQTNASGGYVTLLNAFSDNGGYLATPSNSTNGAAISTTTTLSTNCRWILERYTGEKIDSVKMTSFKSSVECGQSFTYTAYMYDDQIGVNGPVTYRVGNNDYSATDKATIDSNTGELTALDGGVIKVGVTYTNAPWIWWWTVTVDGYASADSAALAFATEIYATSLYIRHEYSTEIYKVTKNGKTLYYYTEPAAGSPHSSSGIDMGRVPSYGTAVAYSHTHPNSNSFSSSDISFANYYQIDAYFNGPNLSVQKYDYSTGQHPIPIATITPTPLTDEQKQALQTEFYDSWYGHIVNGSCSNGFGCGNMTWPTP